MTQGAAEETAEYIDLVRKRADFLSCLTDATLDQRDLRDELGHSTSTVKRALSDLTDAGLVDEVSPNRYRTSPAGVLALQTYDEYVDQFGDVHAATDALAPLEPDTSLSTAVVRDATIALAEDSRYEPLGLVSDTIADATELRIALPAIPDSRVFDQIRDRVVRDETPVELVLSETLLGELGSQFPAETREMASTQSFTGYVGGVPQFGLLLTEDTVIVLVFTDARSVHASIQVRTDRAHEWATETYDQVRRDATDVTQTLAAPAEWAEREREPVSAPSLPPALRSMGFVGLSPSFFERRGTATPETAIRTGPTLSEVAAGYALDRTRPGADGRVNAVTELITSLVADGDHVVVGPPGSGKSTLCRSVAHQWYVSGRGPVIYRESDRWDAFDSPAALRSVLQETTGHALVVVEDAARQESNAIFDVMRTLRGDDTVSFLLDARESEWRDGDDLPTDARLEAYRTEDVTEVSVPRLDERECERFLAHVETVGDCSIERAPSDLLADVRDSDDGESASPGTFSALAHRLATAMNPLADYGVSTTMEEDVARQYDALAGTDALDVAVLVALLDVSGLPLEPAYIHAGAPSGLAVDDALDELTGRIVFGRSSGQFRTRNRSWFIAFLDHVLATEGDAAAHERVARVVSTLLATATDEERRHAIRDRVGGTPFPEIAAEAPGEWAADLALQLFDVGRAYPRLAGLFGRTDRDAFSFPDACPDTLPVRCELKRGKMNSDAGRYDVADDSFTAVTASSDEGALVARANKGRGDVAANQGEYERGERLLEAALDEYRELDDEEGIADTLLSLANIRHRRGEFGRARSTATEARTWYQRLNDDRGAARTLMTRGNAAVDAGEYDDAVDDLELALSELDAVGDTYDESLALLNLGRAYAERGDGEAAEPYYRRGIEVAREVGNEFGAAACHTNLGALLIEREAFDEAAEHLHAGLSTYEEIGARRPAATCQSYLGQIAQERGDFEEAERRMTAAYEIRVDLENPTDVARSLRALGTLALARDDVETARERLEQSLERFETTGLQPETALTRYELAKADRDADDVERATERLEQSVAELREIDADDHVLDVIRELVEVYERTGNDDRAVEWCVEATEIADAPEAVSEFQARIESSGRAG